MILISPTKSFDEYLKSLSKSAKKNYSYVQKANKDLSYHQIPYDSDKTKKFMELWERQLIRGKFVTWAFPVSHIDNLAQSGAILLFEARKGEETIGLHFLQRRNGYLEAHPPMYQKGGERNLGTYMWFELIRYACENDLGHIDMGGGLSDWREMIKRREEFKNPAYKWRFVPENVKLNPDKEQNLYIEDYALRERI